MCGIAGVYNSEAAAELVYYGLLALQHRGQESAGIAVTDGEQIKSLVGTGLVKEVFRIENQPELMLTTSLAAIGHVRYATSGGQQKENHQPLIRETRFGTIALAHNGNLTNQGTVRQNLIGMGTILPSQSDSELILHLMSRSRHEDLESALIKSLDEIQGAYNFLILTKDKIIAVMDPYGFRPLVYGTLGQSHIIASETVALDILKYQDTEASFKREIHPGEVMLFDQKGARVIHKRTRFPESRHCSFEHIYFARRDSRVFEKDVAETREEMGRILAAEAPVDADIVVPVPDSGLDAAIGFAEHSKIKLVHALVKNTYTGRSFINPNQSMRETTVRVKLNPIKHKLQGKRVILVDDSIVRGTTSRKIVRMIRRAGAAEVHLRISSPPVTGPCYYGIDTPHRQKLIASQQSVEEIKNFLTADSLAYLSEKGLRMALGNGGHGFCFACQNGDYPLALDTVLSAELDRRRS